MSAPSVAHTTSAERRRGVALCLVSAVGFGLMAIFAKEAYRAGLGVTSLLAARFVVAAAVFWIIVALRPAPLPPRRLVVACLALGSAGYAAQAGLFFTALQHIDASLTSLLLYTYPALVFCAAVALRRERFTPWKAGALLLASGGAALVLLGGGTGGLESTGVLLALGAAVMYTTYILVADGIVARLDPFLMGALITTGAAATFLVAGATGGTLAFSGGDGWIWIVAIALASTVLPIVTFMLGMKSVGASTASIVSTLEPVVTVALAVALFGEGLGPLQLLGGVLVLAAVVALQSRGLSTVRRRVPSAHAAGVTAARTPASEPA